MTPYHVILKAYPRMNPPMSSKQKRSASNRDNMRRWRSDRNCSTRSRMRAFLQSNRQEASPTLTSDQGPTSQYTTPRHRWQLEGQATTMGSLVGQAVVQIGIPKVETLVVDTTPVIRIVEAKVVVATIVGPTLHKDVDHLMLGAGCLGLAVLEEVEKVAGVMELEHQIIPRVVHMVVQVLAEEVVQVRAEDQTWEVTAISSTTGSS